PLPRSCDHRQVLAPGEVRMEARLLDDRAYARERRLALGGPRTPEQLHRPRGRGGETEQHPDQRRLTGAVRAEVAEGRAARDTEIDVRHCDAVAELLRQASGLDNVHASRLGVRMGLVIGRNGDSQSLSRTRLGSSARTRRSDAFRSTVKPWTGSGR